MAFVNLKEKEIQVKKTSFASSAIFGTNVIETLKRIISLALTSVKKDLV